MSIQEIVLKIKGWAGDYDLEKLHLVIQVLILGVLGLSLALMGYFVGRMQSLRQSVHAEPIQVLYPPQVETVCETPPLEKPINQPQVGQLEPQGNYVASKTGKTYYPKNCKSVNRIKPENRVYFTTVREAIDKGLTLSKSCTSS